MSNDNNNGVTVTTKQPDLVKRIGQTTYRVKVHFSETSKETMKDKILRMIRDEVRHMKI